MNNPIDSKGIFDSRDLIEYKEYLADDLLSTANDTFEDVDDLKVDYITVDYEDATYLIRT